eukprot:c30139_g1_i1 orf=66-284(-)
MLTSKVISLDLNNNKTLQGSFPSSSRSKPQFYQFTKWWCHGFLYNESTKNGHAPLFSHRYMVRVEVYIGKMW